MAAHLCNLHELVVIVMTVEERLLAEDHSCGTERQSAKCLSYSSKALQVHFSYSRAKVHISYSRATPMDRCKVVFHRRTCKHAAQTPEIQGVVIVLQVNQQLRPLEIARGHPHVVPVTQHVHLPFMLCSAIWHVAGMSFRLARCRGAPEMADMVSDEDSLLARVVELCQAPVNEPQLPLLVIDHHLREP